MNTGTSARKMTDIIDLQSYEAGYEEGYQDCQKRARERKEARIQEKRRRLYFLKQKVIGVLILVFTIFSVKLLDGDATIAMLTIPLGLMLIFSKEKWWMDRYCFETEFNEGRSK